MEMEWIGRWGQILEELEGETADKCNQNTMHEIVKNLTKCQKKNQFQSSSIKEIINKT